MKAILIVEDDRALGDGLCLALKGPEAEPSLCRTLSAARSALGPGDFDLLVLDVNLPDGSGLDFLRELRGAANRIPVILLTANDMETDIVAGLESGADDYVTKPFSLAVLRARVNAQLRRGEGAAQGGPILLDGFSFDFARMEFRRDGRLVDLSKTEQKLLRVLVENRGRTLPRDLLVDRVWTDGAEYVDENALSVTVKRLRGKLEDNPSKPRFLKTVYGIGYTWVTGEKEG
jgi:DNA-binding response OmpR family regulator